MRLPILFFLLMTPGFAGDWSGALVDARCWGFEERNVSPHETLMYVDRDRNLEISFCSPKAKTTSFAIVPADGQSLLLDAAGNAKAAELVRNSAGKPPLAVHVTGELNKGTIAVASIASK